MKGNNTVKRWIVCIWEIESIDYSYGKQIQNKFLVKKDWIHLSKGFDTFVDFNWQKMIGETYMVSLWIRGFSNKF